MPQARKRLVSLEDTPYYHCISRCVRRAFLCGYDPLTGLSFEHRRQWIVDRFKKLSSIFAIDLCAYSVMSNHYHLVLRIDVEKVGNWSDRQVANRWTALFSKPDLIKQYLNGTYLSSTERRQVTALISQWRARLVDLSWYMRCLNEPIARIANKEDDCTGRFWEGRFKSQALLDERAVLACMAYVDLNPIRAALAQTPERSDYTSIQERILEPTKCSLRPFSESAGSNLDLSFSREDYLELVDWAGRQIISGKRGRINEHAPPILLRLGMHADPVLNYLKRSRQQSFSALGPVTRLRAFARSVGKHFVKGVSLGRCICPEPG